MKKKSAFPFVEAHWLDACARGGWMPLDVARKEGLVKGISSGFLIEKNKKVTILAQTYAPDSMQVSDLMVIPTGWVQKLTVVRK